MCCRKGHLLDASIGTFVVVVLKNMPIEAPSTKGWRLIAQLNS